MWSAESQAISSTSVEIDLHLPTRPFCDSIDTCLAMDAVWNLESVVVKPVKGEGVSV